MLNDPNEYVETTRARKWPLYLIISVLTVLLGVLVYAVEFSNKKKANEVKPTIAVSDDKPIIVDTGGRGLATPPQPPQPAIPEAPQIVVVKGTEPPEFRRESDELRRQRHQAAMNALSSPLIIRKGKDDKLENKQVAERSDTSEKPAGPNDRLDRLERLAGTPRDGEYNPAADKDKEAFFERSRKSDRQWISSSTRTAGHRFEVKTGSVIPALMIGGISSDLPGQIIAQVAQNVYDTADGRFLLIPQGSRLYGVYDSRIIYGQSRVLVAWNRIIFPDGSAITLESMPGTDSAGYSGFNDEVNNHYFRIFGGALLMTLISGGASWAVDTVAPSNTSLTGNNTPTLQQEMASGLATQLGQTTSKLLEKNINIKPTLEIRPGYRFNVVVTKDLVFKEPYHDQ